MQRPTFHVSGHALILLVLWLLPACRAIPNPDYCAGNGDCDGGWTCDMELNRCMPPPGAECSSDAECQLDNEPICDLDAAMPTCRACESNDECRDKNGAAPFCNTNTGRCTPEVPPDCTTSANCTTPEAPICDTDVGECVSCSDGGGDAACEARNGAAARFCVTDGAGAGSCVQCIDDAACTADAPVCDPTAKTCSACKEHSDCAAYSGVCDAGACAPESEVVYVRQMNSSDANDCSKATPCTTLNRAVAAVTADKENKHFIRILDNLNYGENLSLSNVAVTIIGNDGTRLTAPTDGQPAIVVGAATSLSLDTLTIRSTGNAADGIRCREDDSSLRIENATIRDNTNVGLDVFGCQLIVERSVISGNLGGGVRISDAPFTIINSYILANGSGTSQFGGMVISSNTVADPQLLAFNTILNNNASGSADTRGVDCALPTASPLRATSNILRGGAGGLALLALDNCDWVHSNIEELPAELMAAEKNNIDDACDIAPGTDNLPRIGAASMCKERGEPGTGIDVDYDGDPRPDGSGADKPDIGADEID